MYGNFCQKRNSSKTPHSTAEGGLTAPVKSEVISQVEYLYIIKYSIKYSINTSLSSTFSAIFYRFFYTFCLLFSIYVKISLLRFIYEVASHNEKKNKSISITLKSI